MNWLTLILFSTIVVSFVNILQRLLMKEEKSDPYLYTITFHLLLGSINLALCFFLGFELFSGPFNLVYLFLGSLLWGVGTVFYLKALKSIESSEATIIHSFSSVVTIFFAILLLHEVFNERKATGVLIILISVFMVSKLKKGFRFNNGVMQALFGTLCFGLAVVFDALNIKGGVSPIPYIAVSSSLTGIMLFLSKPTIIQKARNLLEFSSMRKMVTLVVLSSIQATAYYFALGTGNASQIAPISQSQVIITVFLAAILLKERDHFLKKICAALFVVVGIYLLS